MEVWPGNIPERDHSEFHKHTWLHRQTSFLFQEVSLFSFGWMVFLFVCLLFFFLDHFWELLIYCIVFVWQDFEWRWHRGGVCAKLLEASPMSDTTNASWPLLTKVKPICDDSSTSGMMYLRRGEEKKHSSNQKRGMRTCERKKSTDTKISEEGEGGGTTGTRVEISPADHGEDHGEAGCVTAAWGGYQWSRYPPAAGGRP